MKTTATILKPFALVLTTALALNVASVYAEESMDSYNNSNWQSPLVIEFFGLDSTGNGLLLPHEASKGKAFNKKTFAQADTDRDGYIDQSEYIAFKTDNSPTTKNSPNGSSSSGSTKGMTTAEGDAMMDEDMNNTLPVPAKE